MKKFFRIGAFCLTVAALMVSCDPVTDKYDNNAPLYSESEIADLVTFTQANKKGEPQVDGNYITFFAKTGVEIFQKKDDGSENVLARGSQGTFNLLPPRGSDSNQVIYIRVMNPDGSYSEASTSLNVYVATELAPELKIFCSNAGSKKWYWAPTAVNGGAVWGNGGYQAGPQDGSENINGAWWGCGVEDGDCGDKFSGQLQHSKVGAITGEEYSTSYMQFNEDGSIGVFDKDGKQLREGSFSVAGWNNGEVIDGNGNVAILNTTPSAILWPYQINNAGFTPESFEVAYLSVDRMVLIYAPEGTGGWSECTWWSFASDDDAAGCLTSSKWGWAPTEVNGGAVWGNGGYAAGPQDGSGAINGAWWGCGVEDGECGDKFSGQLQHSAAGAITGEEYSTSYMTFGEDGSLAKFDKDGAKLGEGTYSLEMGQDPNGWGAKGILSTSAGAILWPYQINNSGFTPESFEIGYVSSSKLVLIYAPAGTGGWSECTWWSFGAQK